MSRARKIVDQAKLKSLALIGLSNEKIATALGISHDTLTRRFKRELDEARGDGETRLLAKCFQGALAGKVRLLELSLINRCDWRLQPLTQVNVVTNTGGPPIDDAATKAKLFAMHKLVRAQILADNNDDRSQNGFETLTRPPC